MPQSIWKFSRKYQIIKLYDFKTQNEGNQVKEKALVETSDAFPLTYHMETGTNGTNTEVGFDIIEQTLISTLMRESM